MKRKKRTGNAAAGTRSQTTVPKEMRRYVRGRIVDLSDASRYYRRFANEVFPRLQPVLKTKGDDRYQLAAGFFPFYIEVLQQLIGLHYGLPYMNPGDFPAYALYHAGRHFRIATLVPMDDRTIGQEFELWPPTRPVSEAWERFGKSGFPINREGYFAVPPCDAEALRVGEPGKGRLALRLRFSHNRQALPKVTVEIEGEPVCVLMKGMQSLNPRERRAVRDEAKKIWRLMVKKLSSWAGISQAGPGHPAENLGGHAAFLHDHRGLTWLQVAENLCPLRHKHESCKLNFRIQAIQFYQHLRKAVPPPFGSRKTIP